jgi:hypothetical protein
MKRRLQDDPQWSARTAYYTEVNQITVRDVALAPPLSSVERALQRHKVHNCPPLPVFCQDLVLQQQHTTISSGLPFLLINDGFADRILVWNRGKLTKVSYRVSRVRYCYATVVLCVANVHCKKLMTVSTHASCGTSYVIAVPMFRLKLH